MPVPNAWQGRSQAVVRVLDKLDAHVEILTLKAGETGSYKSLIVTVRSCMDRPDGMPRDDAAFLDVQDQRGALPPFSGWSFSGEPSIGVFESPVYGIQLVACDGDLAAPAAPPLPPPVPPPPSLQQPAASDAAVSTGAADSLPPEADTPDSASPETAPQGTSGSSIDPPDQPPGNSEPGDATPRPPQGPDQPPAAATPRP